MLKCVTELYFYLFVERSDDGELSGILDEEEWK